MSTRFRIRFLGGGETTVESLGAFCDLVQSGRVTSDDLVHDALTGEWVPAVSHPMYKLALDPLVAMEGDGSAASGEPDALFELADPSPEFTPESAEADFIRQMEMERAADPDSAWVVHDLSPVDGVIDLGVEPVHQEQWQAEEPGSQRRWYEEEPTPQQQRHAEDPGAQRQWLVDEPSRPAVRVRGPQASGRRAPPMRDRRLLRTLALILVLGGVGVAGGAGLAWPELRAAIGAQGLAPVTALGSDNIDEEAVSRAAFESFLGKVASLGTNLGVGSVPSAWLEGRYLANASAFPEVGSYWARYRDYVEAARDRDRDLYRAAYLESLERQGVRGAQHSPLVATAMSAFSQDRSRREAAYDRAAALADAAIELHELSVTDAARISYEPARSNRVSADPVIEAAGRDAEIQAALDAALDRVLAALHGNGTGTAGPGRDGVGGWLVEMLKTPATSR